MPLSTWFYMPFQLHRRVGPNIQIYHKIIMKADCMSFCLPPYCSSLDIDRRHIQNLQRRMCSQQVSLDAPRLPDREQQRLAAEVQGSCSWSSVEFSGRGFSSEEETVYIYIYSTWYKYIYIYSTWCSMLLLPIYVGTCFLGRCLFISSVHVRLCLSFNFQTRGRKLLQQPAVDVLIPLFSWSIEGPGQPQWRSKAKDGQWYTKM